jgi:hypothetical protein
LCALAATVPTLPKIPVPAAIFRVPDSPDILAASASEEDAFVTAPSPKGWLQDTGNTTTLANYLLARKNENF